MILQEKNRLKGVLPTKTSFDMMHFSQLISPVSWLVMLLGVWPWWVVIFTPSLQEVLICVLADTAAYFVFDFLLKRRENKDSFTALFTADDIDFDAIGKLSEEDQRILVKKMLTFPMRRTRNVLSLSILKVVPAMLIITLVWEHSIPTWLQFLNVSFGVILTHVYFYACLLSENHILICKRLALIHDRVNLTKAFDNLSIPYSRQEFEQAENIVLMAIVVFMLALQAFVLAGFTPAEPLWYKVTKVVSIGTVGFLLLTRIIWLSRKFFRDGLEDIFARFQDFKPSKMAGPIALHSHPILTHFTQVFNSLQNSLNAYEKELSHWIFAKAEESRYQALGEIAGLVVHDLSAPLHVIDFCVKQIKEQPDLVRSAQYQSNLELNSERALNLIHSIRSYLRTNQQESGASIALVHREVIRILESQFHGKNFNKIDFRFDPRLQTVNVNLSRPDITHVIHNLYANSVENMLTHGVAEPTIHSYLHRVDEGQVTIAIADNGTGLNADEFEKFTSFSNLWVCPGGERKGLGLRLIRRLVERSGGSLAINSEVSRGTCFLLQVQCIGEARE